MKWLFTNEAKRNLLIDCIILILFLIVYEVKATGVTIHEWLGVAFGIIAIIHIIMHWKWIIQISKQFFQKLKIDVRIKYIVDFFIFFGFTTIIFTGLMMSRSLLPSLGIQTMENHFWHETHSVSVDLTLLLTALHFALSWKWVARTFKQYVINPLQRIFTSINQPKTECNTNKVIRFINFPSVLRFTSRFTLILILSGFISLGWYAVSKASVLENSINDKRFQIEQSVKTDHASNPDPNPAFHRPDHDDHAGYAFIVAEIFKNILIFTIVTISVTFISNKIKNKKTDSLLAHNT